MRITLEVDKDKVGKTQEERIEHFSKHIKRIFPNIGEHKITIDEKKDRIIGKVVQG